MTLVAFIGRFRADGEKTLFTDYRFVSLHPNVYFFCLLGFLVSVLMVASWYTEFVNRGSEWAAYKRWILLAAMSLFTALSALCFRERTEFGEFTDPNEHNISMSDFVASINSLTMADGMINHWNVENTTVGNRMIKNLTIENLTEHNLTEKKLTDPIRTVFEVLLEDEVFETLPTCDLASYSCVRINYLIGLSLTTFVIACFMARVTESTPTCQIDISIILFLFWLCSLPQLTVSPGPATRAGNMYFGIYICFFLVLSIFITTCTCKLSAKKAENNRFSDIENDDEFVSRDDLWQAAYGKLERSKTDERDENDSVESLFEPRGRWDDWDEQHKNRIPMYEHDKKVYGSRSSKWPTSRSRNKPIYMSKFNLTGLFPDEDEEDSIDHSSGRQNYVTQKDLERRVVRLSLWCVLLTMAIVLTRTLIQYGVKGTEYIATSTSIFVSCIGIITCLRTSKHSNILEIVAIIIAFADWVYGAFLFSIRYDAHVFGSLSPEKTISLLLGEEHQNLADHPNLFFDVWISVVAVILLITNRCKASLITADWILFATSSLALLISSMEQMIEKEDLDDSSKSIFPSCDRERSIYCNNITFTQYLAAASLVLSLLMALLFRRGPILHMMVSIPLVIAWGFGVPYLVLLKAKSIPADFYFAFWGGIFLALEITSINMLRLKRTREKSLNENGEDGIDLSVEMKEEQLSSKKNETDAPDLHLANSLQSKIVFDSQDSHQNVGHDSDGHFESNTDGRRKRDDGAEENHVGEPCRANIKSFFDESHQMDESSIDTNPRESSQSYIDSNCDDNQHHHVNSTTSSEFTGRLEQNKNQDDNHGLTSTDSIFYSAHLPTKSPLNNNQQSGDRSMDSDDFIDCSQFESSSDIFHSTRSTV